MKFNRTLRQVFPLIATLAMSAPTIANECDLFAFDPDPKLTYQIFGDDHPTTVILIHGLGGEKETWLNVARDLAISYRVVIYDQRGHGGTDPAGVDYSSGVMASDLLRLYDELNIERAHLVGHSMGARTAMRFAHDHPERTLSVVLEDMHMKSLERVKGYQASYARHDILKTMPASFANWDEFRQLVSQRSEEEQQRIWGIELVFCKDQRWRIDAPTLYGCAGLREDLTPYLQGTAVPMFFMAGDPTRDGTVLHGVGLKHIHDTRPDAKILVFEGAAHGIHVEQRYRFVQELQDFFQSM